jgi:malonyl-CoA O-methyltransferase
MLQIFNNKIQLGFSRSAKSYDLFTGLHREIADKLFAQVIKERAPSALLDVGCGTGYLTVKIKDHFPQSKIIGLDFSLGMLEVASPKHEGIDWVLADSNKLPFSDGSFDILISNLAYQWAGDLPQAFSEARRVLVPNGVLACTLFGYDTCRELFQSLDEAKAKALQFARLPDVLQVRQALAAGGFKNPEIESERIKIEFNSMHELTAWLKSIGANNLSRTGYLGPGSISRAASIYRKKFYYLQGVGATFEVIRVYVKK